MHESFDFLELENLSSVAVLPDGAHIHILQKCTVCLEMQGHSSPTKLTQHDLRQASERHEILEIRWKTTSTARWRKAYADVVESAEDSAKGLAFLLMRRLGYDFCAQAPRGARVDYFMSKSNSDQDDTFIFNGPEIFGLEISGILKDPSKVRKRLQEKKERIVNGNGFKPSLIVVVEHSLPQATIEMVC